MRYDVVIIGSGFGGSVMAARLGRHVVGELGGSVLLLEKGNDHSGRFDPESNGPAIGPQGHRFRNSLSPEYLSDLTELHTDLDSARSTMNIVAGKGFGGGSNVYCGVSLRAPQFVFERSVDHGRAWPTDWNRSGLDPHYARVEEMLRVHRLAWTADDAPHWQLVTKRDFVFAEACKRIGASAAPLKVATHNDANDGWWTSGQVHEGRQDLSKNYLQVAFDSGVEFQSGCNVRRIATTDDGYVISGVDERGDRPRTVEIECKMLVVAAGAVGSTSLLMRSVDGFAGQRRPRTREEGGTLGTGLSSNGDYGVMGIVGREFEMPVEGFKGKPMCSFSPSFWQEHGILIIPFYAEPLYPALGQFSTLVSPDNPLAVGRRSTTKKRGVRDWGEEYTDQLRHFGGRMLTMGCLALDEGEGEVLVDSPDGPAQVRWSATDPRTEARWSKALTEMRRLYESLGGELFADGYRTDGAVNTSHPLGGCRMSDSRDTGVVNSLGEVYDNPNLFVVDGSTIPAALGVNPSLTIAAMAERIAASLERGEGTASLRERLG